MSRFQSLLASSLRFSQLSMWPGSKELQLAKETVAPLWQSSTGWMPERTGRLTIVVGHRHLVTMCKASLRTLSMRQVCAL